MLSHLFTILITTSVLAIDPSDNAFNALEKVQLTHFDLAPPFIGIFP
jgi:hypothetical protein